MAHFCTAFLRHSLLNDDCVRDTLSYVAAYVLRVYLDLLCPGMSQLFQPKAYDIWGAVAEIWKSYA